MLGLGVFDFFIGFTDYFYIDALMSSGLSYFPDFFIYPILYSILTHFKFDEKAGLWLGLLMGIPSLLVAIINISLLPFEDYVFGIIAFLLLIVVFIWLRENRTYLKELLELNVINIENTKEEPEDPFDHLVN